MYSTEHAVEVMTMIFTECLGMLDWWVDTDRGNWTQRNGVNLLRNFEMQDLSWTRQQFWNIKYTYMYLCVYIYIPIYTHTHIYSNIHVWLCICDNYINKKWIITTKSKDTDYEESINRYMFLELILLTKIYTLHARWVTKINIW